jgi:uncharacterized membrane-anchored protein
MFHQARRSDGALAEISLALNGLKCAGAEEVVALLEESKALIEQRNSLVHACVFSKGRVLPNAPDKSEFYVTPETLTALAEAAFNWKERLDAAVQRRLVPALQTTLNRRRGANADEANT